MAKTKTSDEIQRLLKTVFERCMHEDDSVRQRQLRQWRRLKLMWEGYSQIWYSEVAHDWRVWDELNVDDGTDQAAYDKPVNVFKAYLESIIAALSVTVPPIKCFPDDADNTLDLSTARTGDKIAQLIYRHNDAPLKWLHALFVYVTEGCVAFYNYAESDEKYGTYENKEYDENEEEEDVTTCPNCGYELSRIPTSQAPTAGMQDGGPAMPPQQMGMGDAAGQQDPNMMPPAPMQQQGPSYQDAEKLGTQELNEYDPGDEDPEIQYKLLEGQELCPSCMQMMDPEISRDKFIVTRLTKITNEPKTRICINAYGGLNIKIPNYARKQCDIPYLIFSQERNYVQVVEEYEHLHGNKNLLKNLKTGGSENAGAYNQYEQWARLSPQYQGEYPVNVITENKAWLRPSAFNFLSVDDAKKLKKLYPNGCCVTYENDEFAEAYNQSLDDHWTITENPMSDYLHFAPLGQTLVSIQEITNDMISLVLQTIEHGIGQTFADPGVLNFNAYEQTEVTPGGIFPAIPKSGKSLNDGFMELRTATLSSEVMPFYAQIQSAGQTASGALPSIFGGQIEGSETASEYSMSRAQALQRLQNTWKLFTTTWKTVFMKVIPMYIKEVQYDEKDVQRTDDGNFINTFINRADMEGKIGKMELEANENLPLTWGQKKDLLMQLMTNQNPMIQQILMAPENLSVVHEALGLTDFYLPGEDDVIQQYDEIKLCLQSAPIPTGDPMQPFVSSVEIDPIMDNSQIGFEIVRKWAISEVGRQTKITNEPGYQNVLLHGKMHHDQMMQMQMMQQQQQAELQGQSKGGPPPKKANPKTAKEAPITENRDVQTVQ